MLSIFMIIDFVSDLWGIEVISRYYHGSRYLRKQKFIWKRLSKISILPISNDTFISCLVAYSREFQLDPIYSPSPNKLDTKQIRWTVTDNSAPNTKKRMPTNFSPLGLGQFFEGGAASSNAGEGKIRSRGVLAFQSQTGSRQLILIWNVRKGDKCNSLTLECRARVYQISFHQANCISSTEYVCFFSGHPSWRRWRFPRVDLADESWRRNQPENSQYELMMVEQLEHGDNPVETLLSDVQQLGLDWHFSKPRRCCWLNL